MWISDRDFFGFIAILIAFGVVAGLAIAWGIPWVWAIVKPLLHGWTA